MQMQHKKCEQTLCSAIADLLPLLLQLLLPRQTLKMPLPDAIKSIQDISGHFITRQMTFPLPFSAPPWKLWQRGRNIVINLTDIKITFNHRKKANSAFLTFHFPRSLSGLCSVSGFSCRKFYIFQQNNQQKMLDNLMESAADEDSLSVADSNANARIKFGYVVACRSMSWHVAENVMKIQLKMAFARVYEPNCRIARVCVVTSL